jgi:hypothetical protein
MISRRDLAHPGERALGQTVSLNLTPAGAYILSPGRGFSAGR